MEYKMNKISEKKIERLSLYRRRLLIESVDKDYIYSHELAEISNSNAAQVRRDLMKLGYSGAPKKGYRVIDLINYISDYLDPKEAENVVIVGAGNLGHALLTFFRGRRPKLCLVAAFDIDPEKIGRDIGGVFCYHLSELPKIIKKMNIKIGIISTTETATREVAQIMISSGIKSIINFTCMPLKDTEGVYIEQIDITASFEKAAFFTK